MKPTTDVILPDEQDKPDPLVGNSSGRKVEFRFVGQDDIEERKSARAGGVKAAHKKSRNGCIRCRARRVKCDEVHPVCSSCERHQAACVYGDISTPTSRQTQLPLDQSSSLAGRTNINSQTTRANAVSSDTFENSENSENSETSARRLLELKLMHIYSTKTCYSIVLSGDPTGSEAWIYKAPALALNNPALLCALISLTALHMTGLDSSDATEMMFTHHIYWDMALQEHKSDLTRLGARNFDAVCTTSTFIRLNALVMLRDRPLVPYAPPTEWLQTTRGAMKVFEAAHPWVQGSGDSITANLIKRMPFCFDDDAKFGASNRQCFFYLLDQIDGDNIDDMPVKDQAALKSTVSYIGGIWLVMSGATTNAGTNTPSEICRRLILLPYFAHDRYIELVTAGHPRALVILAHFFAMLSTFHEAWWIGATGARETQALGAVLPSKWQPLMEWPMDMISNQIF